MFANQETRKMGDQLPKLRLAAVQATAPYLDREAAVEKACRLIREAGAGGANMVGFPENFIPGHPVWYYFHPAFSPKSMDLAAELFKNSVEIPGPETDALCEAAADAGVFVVIGLTEKRPDTTGTLFNTQLFIDKRGTIVGKHQKLVPTMAERIVHMGGNGDTQGAIATEWGPVSGLICGENSNPMATALLAAQYTRIHVASWPHHFKPTPGYPDMPEMSLMVSRNIAYTCKAFVISACGVVTAEMLERLPATDTDREWLRDPAKSGGSVIIDPRGVVIAGPMSGDQEGILYADVDLELNVRSRVVHDFGGHYNRSDVFRLFVNQSKPPLIGSMSEPAGWQTELREVESLELRGLEALPPHQRNALAAPRDQSAIPPAKLADKSGKAKKR
jgi:nitrilase